MKNRVNLRIDLDFKQLFGSKGNEDILMGFFKCCLTKIIRLADYKCNIK